MSSDSSAYDDPNHDSSQPADEELTAFETGDVLLHESSPDGAVQAVVEQDDRVVYFYLHSQRPWLGMKSCWVRNLVPGPATLDSTELQSGLAPRLPRTSCNHPRGAEKLVADELEVVWMEACDGAALCLAGEPLAIIPPWSGEGGFHGYARDCRDETPVAWPMPNHPALLNRINEAREWWNSWREENVWSTLQRLQLAAYEAYLGAHDKYFQIDGGHWPPKGLASFPLKAFGESSKLEVLATIGVAIRPQPMVERFTDDPQSLERIEIAAIATEPTRMACAQWLSSAANYPWHYGAWLGAGHTMERSDSTESDESNGNKSKIALIAASELPSPLCDVTLAEFRESPTNLLVAIPLDASSWQRFKLVGIEGIREQLSDLAECVW